MARKLSERPDGTIAPADLIGFTDVSAGASFSERFDEFSEILASMLALPSVIAYDDDLDEWPAATTPAGRVVIWIQPNVGGDAPPAGGRPGREPGDLVFIAQ